MKNHVKELRTARGLSQVKLAKACGLHSRLLQKLESGEHDISGVRLRTVLALSDALGVSVEDLYTRDPMPAPEQEDASDAADEDVERNLDQLKSYIHEDIED